MDLVFTILEIETFYKKEFLLLDFIPVVNSL